MKAHLKKHWLKYLMAGVIIFPLIQVLSPGPTIDSHKTEAEALRRENADLKKLLASSDRKQDSLTGEIKKGDSAIAELRVEQKVKDKELKKTKATALSLSQDVKELAHLDTTELARKADSLQETTRWLIELNNAYVELTDSLNAATDRNKADYEHLLTEKDKAYTALKSAYDRMLVSYESLFTDYQKLAKKVKRKSLLTKITAVIAGAAVVLAAVK